MLDKRLDKTGTILMHEGTIQITGFEADDCMCREVAALACLWAIGELQKEVTALIAEAGSGNSAMDLRYAADRIEREAKEES